MRSSRKLKQIYNLYNRQYFNDLLPDDAVVRWATLAEMNSDVMRELDGRYFNEDETPNDKCLILINPELKKRDRWLHMTLLHEMNHDWTDNERGIHEIGFEAGMLRLANMGAFKGLW